MTQIKIVSLCDGKYTISKDDKNRLKFFRYNDPWEAVQEMMEYNNMIHAMVDRILELEELHAQPSPTSE